MLEFGQALRSRMNSEAAQLPHGIEMTKIADQSAVVEEAVSGFVHVLGEAVIIVLAVSLFHWVCVQGLWWPPRYLWCSP